MNYQDNLADFKVDVAIDPNYRVIVPVMLGKIPDTDFFLHERDPRNNGIYQVCGEKFSKNALNIVLPTYIHLNLVNASNKEVLLVPVDFEHPEIRKLSFINEIISDEHPSEFVETLSPRRITHGTIFPEKGLEGMM